MQCKANIDAHVGELFSLASEADGDLQMTQKVKDQYTVQKWFAWKEKHQNTEADQKYPFSEFKKDLEEYLPFLQICFPATKDVPLRERTVFGLLGNIFKCQPHSGDCTTLSVMRVPDPEVELVRALIDFPENRERLMPKLIELMVKKSSEDKSFDGTAWREKVIAKLMVERQIAPGSRGAVDTIVKVPVYQAAQLQEARYAIQKAIQLEFAQRLDKKHETSSVEQRNQQFLEFKLKLDLIHRNPCRDSIFGIKNTASWKAAMAKIRADALIQLEAELKEKKMSNKKFSC